MSTALKLMTVDEILAWAEGQEGRWELHDGVPVMMSPERVIHVRIPKVRPTSALREAASRALGCDVRGTMPTAAAIRIERRGDLSTRMRRDRLWSASCPIEALEIDNLIIVVEVLSPSTAAIDHGRKLSGYFSLPSVEHYLILDPERRVVDSPQARRKAMRSRRGSSRTASCGSIRPASRLRSRRCSRARPAEVQLRI